MKKRMSSVSSKYVDTTAIMQVIGTVYNNPQILNLTEKYTITEEDFAEDFHRVVYGAIYKLFELGTTRIDLRTISDFLSTRPKSLATYTANKGEEYLNKVSDVASLTTFDYYYNRMKKMSLLRAYDNIGLDVRFIYDPDNIFDTKKKEVQEETLDNSSLEHLANLVDDKIQEIRASYVDNSLNEAVQAGEGALDLIEKYKLAPEVGVPLYGPLINTACRGARLRKLYLRSAATNVGKTRSMIADACYIACNKYYDATFGWVSTGQKEPTLFIATEQEKDEIQTMMMAFLSNVNESHILDGQYLEGEEERVIIAANILAESPLFIEELPDFSLQDVENTIKKNVRDRDIKYVFNPKRVKGTVKYFSANQAGLAA